MYECYRTIYLCHVLYVLVEQTLQLVYRTYIDIRI
jgi:hypothetical protein